jgi:hypothetical protein
VGNPEAVYCLQGYEGIFSHADVWVRRLLGEDEGGERLSELSLMILGLLA